MRSLLIILILITVTSCNSDTGFSIQDEEEINRLRRDYTNGWLANDSETVLGLFADDATIIPSGLAPITGKEAITAYWFPNDSSETIIHTYSIELLEMHGTDSMAYTLEKGALNFTYTLKDFSMTKESISHATTIYKKNKEGNWLITSRMWTSLNK